MVFLKNGILFILCVFAGGAVNMGLIMLGSNLVPAPEGIDPTNMESLQAGMHLFEAKHFLFPFLAHAGGTFVAALGISLLIRERTLIMAMASGGFFLLGGTTNAFLLPVPAWYIVVDLLFAYLPLAYAGYFLAMKIRGSRQAQKT